MISGRCLCGAVRLTIDAAPIVTRTCWCRLCQYLAAGNATVNVAFPTSAVSIEGSPARFESVADSGSRMVRSFCGACGTPLFSEARERPHLIFVRAGTLDDPEIAQPSMAIWTSAAPSWACLDQAVPQVERQPPPAS
jgi:hypothetical protein